jgi:hypothetical protein
MRTLLSSCLLAIAFRPLIATSVAPPNPRPPAAGNWYEQSLFLLHEDHHVERQDPVGRAADKGQITRLLRGAAPDHVQMIAKGAYGMTTYPSAVGFAPPQLGADVLGLWRDATRAEGKRFGVYINPCNDREIRIRHPEWLRLGPDGKPRDQEVKTASAVRTGMVGSNGKLWSIALCMQSGVVEVYLWPLLREIIEKYQPDSIWFDGLGGQADPCYCKTCRAQFEQATGKPAPVQATDPGWAEFKVMQRRVYHTFLEETLAEIHRLSPHCLVTHNGAYTPSMPEKPPAGLGFLSKDYVDHSNMISPYSHYLDSVGLPYEIMAEIFTADPALGPEEGWTESETIPKPPEQIKQEVAAILANGGRYNLWDIPTRSSALVEERFDLIQKVVAPFIRQREPWCLGTRRPDVSILYSSHVQYARLQRSAKLFGSNEKWLKQVDERLRGLHLNYEYVTDWRLAAGDVRGQLLLVDDPVSIAPETVEAVLQYANRGGRVIWSGNARHARLTAVLGLQGGPGAAVETVTLETVPGSFRSRFHQVTSDSARTVFAASLASGGRHPYLLAKQMGAGEVYYAAGPLFPETDEAGAIAPPGLAALFARLLPDAERLLTTDVSDKALATVREKGGEYVIHLANLSPGKRRNGTWRRRSYQVITDVPPIPACSVSVKLAAKPATVYLQPQGRKIDDWLYRNGRLEVAVPSFDFHQMVVITPSSN